MREKILERLQSHLDYLYTVGPYNTNNIVGIFLYGSNNYGFANENSDVDSVAIYVPSFAELCLNKGRLSKELHTIDKEHIVLKDIREYREMLMKQNINFLETLFTDYYILNPRFEEIFKVYFMNNKELIATYDRKKMYTSIIGQVIHTLNQGMEDNKKLYNAYRLTYFLKEYYDGKKSFEECLRPTGDIHAFLWNLKYDTMKYTFSEKKSIAEDIFLDLKDLQEKIKVEDYCQAGTALKALDAGTMALLRLNCDEAPDTGVDLLFFFKQLTIAENEALVTIVKSIQGNSGMISIQKLIDTYNISRPVYTSLLKKLADYKVAEIEKHGVKGTKINFLISDTRKLLHKGDK